LYFILRYNAEIINKEPDFRSRMRAHDERDAEFASRTLRQIEEDQVYQTTTGRMGAAVSASSSRRPVERRRRVRARGRRRGRHPRRVARVAAPRVALERGPDAAHLGVDAAD
jgi:hypothetical protein